MWRRLLWILSSTFNIHKSIDEMMPEVKILGCFFHLAKAFKDKIYLFIAVQIQGGTKHCITNLWYKVFIVPKPFVRLCPNNPQFTFTRWINWLCFTIKESWQVRYRTVSVSFCVAFWLNYSFFVPSVHLAFVEKGIFFLHIFHCKV